MSKEVRAVTYRLYPNKGQEIMMNHFLDCTRKVYNRLVEICRTYIEKQLSFPSEIYLMKMVTKIRQRNFEMQDVHSHCFQSVAKRVHYAFIACRVVDCGAKLYRTDDDRGDKRKLCPCETRNAHVDKDCKLDDQDQEHR